MEKIKVAVRPEQESLLKELFSFREWRQRINLFGEVCTPGTRCEYEWEYCHLPADLSGKTFLDVGANDGMFSFLAESRNAKKVTAVDLYVEGSKDLDMINGWSVERIRMIRDVRKSKINIVPCSVYDLSKRVEGKFDHVFCGNVIAWLESPVAAIRELADKCSETLFIREDISRITGKPLLEYVNNRELNGCFFNGNKEFYTELLSALGFREIEFKKIDGYGIFERRSGQFKKYTAKAGTVYYSHPFGGAASGTMEKSISEFPSLEVNGKVFFNRVGWIEPKFLDKLPEAIPVNLIKKELFKRERKRTIPENYMIIAKR
jgi:tRNA (mo5U34)-methyltransferase